jgi:hypothetical protein
LAKLSFYTLKIGFWDLLQAHQVWFKKAPGRVKQTPLVAIGFWMNVHPGFASPRVFHTNIIHDIEKQYSHHPKVLKTFCLPADYSPSKFYLSRSKIHAEYTEGGTIQPIDTDALMLCTSKSTAELAIIYLTRLSSFSTATNAADPMFILLAAKCHTPTKFGELFATQMTFSITIATFASWTWLPTRWILLLQMATTYGLRSADFPASFDMIHAAGLPISANGIYHATKTITQRFESGSTSI